MNQDVVNRAETLNAEIAYFDTSAMDHLHRRWGVTDQDERKLRETAVSGRIVIPVSVVTLEEFLFEGRTLISGNLSPKALLMLELVAPAKIVKPAQRLLADDIMSFVATGGAASPFVSGEARRHLSLALDQLRHGDGSANLPVLRNVAALAVSQKSSFLAGMISSREQALQLAKADGLDFTQIPFEIFLALTAPSVAAEYAKALGVENECRERGVEKLLGLRSVAMAAGLPLSLIYGLLAEKREPNRGDGRDQQHGVMAASCADIFVTDDRNLRRLARRLDFGGLKILSLTEFLQSL